MEKKRFDIINECPIANNSHETGWVGIISDDKKYCFYRTRDDREDGRTTCYIYSTLADLIDESHPLASYLWTSENDTKLLDALTDGTPLCKVEWDTKDEDEDEE